MSKPQLSQKKSDPTQSSQVRRRKYLQALLAVFMVGVLVVGVFFLIKLFPKEEGPPRKMVQQITVITPPPPPPPPPPKEEIKEPEVEEEPIKEEADAPPNDEPQEEAPEAGAGDNAQAGNDSFGLKPGGGGGGRPGRGAYEQSVRAEINEFITEDDRLKRMDYIAELKLKIAESGEFEQYEVEIISGDAEAADAIRKVLKNKRKLDKPRPLEAPSVVKLRIKSVL